MKKFFDPAPVPKEKQGLLSQGGLRLKARQTKRVLL
jgi:hypothetical protein